MKKKTLIGISVAVVAFVAILLVATFFDLQINIALGNADSFYGQFFRMWGEATGWIIVPIAAAILLRACDKSTKIGKALTVLWAIVLVAGWFLTVRYFLEEFTGDSYIPGKYGSPYGYLTVHTAFFALIFSALHVWAVYRVKKETISKLVYLALVMLIALALSQLVTNVMKNVWTRQRFRNLDIGNGGTSSEGFTPWYKPGLGKNKEAALYYVEDSAGMMKKDAYKSFPSGHTCGAAMSLCLIVLPETFDKLKKYKVWFWIAPIVYTVLVAISRIVNRAHYLSDVLFGGTIGALGVFAAIGIMNAVKKAVGKNKFFTAAAVAFGATERCGAAAPTEIEESCESTVSVPSDEKPEEVNDEENTGNNENNIEE